MLSNITRFYLEPTEGKTGEMCRFVEDIETIDADKYEKTLQNEGIDYIRVDL